ncbi:hypothetical protein CJD36_004375 [Flavipsychrobacter stenotrophus]|uniref:Recombinase family protein n=1 Tax=Flavipsychrobacter stenotrophus TaxID=2077091 RepID=A0A2S7T2J8_9BACT|nr:recombinase family protein [Flavipsychrobacter stenotrophus]PQJ12986.1 hypothetical protein CJD36_004375 [Flavipsychrobacter stenotrophus]
MENPSLKKAVIYCRVSTKEQVDEGGSLATQERICKDYAIKNGFQISEIFIEQGESAKNADRTELKKLLSYCANKKNGVTAIIAYKIDRIARNIDDYRQIRLLLKQYKIEIKSTTEYFEDNPAGRFMENIIANVAQFDNDVRTERSINGSRDAMREGRYVWGAPYGYSNEKVAGKSTILPNEKAPLIRKIFEEIGRDEIAVDAVRKLLFKEGLTTKTGKKFTKSHYYRLINNPVYAGWIVKFGERHKGTFEALISQQLFDQVQRILKRRSHRSNGIYRNEHPDFPLRRFVFHPTGKKITGAWSQGRHSKYAYYRFIGVENSNYQKEWMESEYLSFLDQYVFDRNQLATFKKSLSNALDGALKEQYKIAAKLKTYISELEERQTTLIDKNVKGIINDTVLRRQLEDIEVKLSSTTSELLRLPERDTNLEEAFAFAEEYLENPSYVWSQASLEKRIKLQWFEFPKGITFDGKRFRTIEVASIFKAKELFLPRLSLTVPSKGQNYEQDNKSGCENDIVECQQYAEEIKRLSNILKNTD